MSAAEAGAERPILIVEDDRAAAELVRLHLAHEGYEVVMAADGAEGLRLARECEPKLIVLDLMLPGMDGLELCRALRAVARLTLLSLAISRSGGIFAPTAKRPFSICSLIAFSSL